MSSSISSKEHISVSAPGRSLKATIQLTGSKSESNRALIMQALSEGRVKVNNLSKAADTVTLEKILEGRQPEGIQVLDVGPAGTAMRFLTAYAAMQPEEIILTGSERMQQRPVGILVDALRDLGADIRYQAHEGYPPLKIKGPLQQKAHRIRIKGNISSQYISALLLIGPRLPLGLELQIEGELTSTPYVEMTLAMLEQAGIMHQWDSDTIVIEPQEFRESVISIEPDWSAASYWYAIAALSEEASFFLPGLNAYSLQGDSRITEIMANFGITSQFKDGGVYLEKEPKQVLRKIFDFKDCPDLAQTVIVCCAALGHDATFTGLETLKIKETDRIKALQQELEKIGVKLIEKNLTCKLDCSGLHFPESVSISTYEDHRMAMAFAPLALKIRRVEIQDPGVVEKSYPHFWEDLKKAGIIVN
ncbi:3-phosphoshikimate 1-carboxyvinyltransferase [Flavihumibacter sp. R14]|nr:3-phosphoshikimate 1-carboxyvinyltransferase [Flavihumibacter soli]